MATRTAERARLPADERREVIRKAAGRLFARHGYAATRLEDIAAAAGVTKPIVYRHFHSKKGLYLALLAKHEEDLPTFFVGVDRSSGIEATVRAILDRWFDYVRENQHAWIMLFRDSSGDDEIRALRQRVNRRAHQVLAAFIAEQPGSPIPAEQVDPTAELLTSGLAGLALWWIDHPDITKEVMADVAARIIITAVAGP
jgi:AcrR family transcriptional regulator